jgi:Protein of unknown function (DUF2946)
VTGWWRRNRSWRGAVGIVVGQLLVLQFLFAGIVATQMAVDAAALPAITCLGDAHTQPDSGSGQPKSEHMGCAVCVFASAAPLLPDAPTELQVPLSFYAPLPTLITQIKFADLPRDPRTSRGPPDLA